MYGQTWSVLEHDNIPIGHITKNGKITYGP